MNNLSKVNVFFQSTGKFYCMFLAQIPCRSKLSAIDHQSFFVSEEAKFPFFKKVCNRFRESIVIHVLLRNGHVALYFRLLGGSHQDKPAVYGLVCKLLFKVC